jgi:phage terminase Nu1 subunit (DNA packaging protein)
MNLGSDSEPFECSLFSEQPARARLVGTAVLAAHLDLSERRITALADEHVFDQVGRGAWDLDGCRIQYIRWLRGRPGSEGASARSDAARLRRIQADSAEMEFKQRQAQLLDAGLVGRKWSETCATVRDHLRSIPGIIAPQLVGLGEQQICAFILEEIDMALTVLSKGEIHAPDADR